MDPDIGVMLGMPDLAMGPGFYSQGTGGNASMISTDVYGGGSIGTSGQGSAGLAAAMIVAFMFLYFATRSRQR